MLFQLNLPQMDFQSRLSQKQRAERWYRSSYCDCSKIHSGIRYCWRVIRNRWTVIVNQEWSNFDKTDAAAVVDFVALSGMDSWMDL